MRTVSLEQATAGVGQLAIGTFDGVHLGHREVIADAASVLTFDPHPVSVLRPSHTPRILTPLPIKADIIASLGVEELIVIDFDAAFATRGAAEFVEEVIVGRLAAAGVSVGENFRFGRNARGDAAMLAADSRFQTRVVPLRELDGEVVSSSQIRSLIAAGEVGRAARMLGAPFELRGTVVEGDRRGRELGFPTANLVPDERLAEPGHGVYACLASIPSRPAAGAVPAAVNVGVRPTFESGRGELIEAYLIDFEGDLYGGELRLRFLERLRGERRFESADALIAAMHDDVARVRAICASASFRRPMTLTAERKRELAREYGRDEQDTGNTKVQVAQLTERINELTDHLRTHGHDHHSRRGLLMLVGRRRRFLDYLQRTDIEGYRALISSLGLRK